MPSPVTTQPASAVDPLRRLRKAGVPGPSSKPPFRMRPAGRWASGAAVRRRSRKAVIRRMALYMLMTGPSVGTPVRRNAASLDQTGGPTLSRRQRECDEIVAPAPLVPAACRDHHELPAAGLIRHRCGARSRGERALPELPAGLHIEGA